MRELVVGVRAQLAALDPAIDEAADLHQPGGDDAFTERLRPVRVRRELRHEPLHDTSHQALAENPDGPVHERLELGAGVSEIGYRRHLRNHVEEDGQRELLSSVIKELEPDRMRKSGLVIPEVPERPTNEDVARAKSLIFGELIPDFPFADDASKANAAGSCNPEAKVLCTPAGVILIIFVLPPLLTNKSPRPSKANPIGPINPEANVLRTPFGVNS